MILNCLLIYPDCSAAVVLQQYIACMEGIAEVQRLPDVYTALRKLGNREIVTDIIFVALPEAPESLWPAVKQLHRYGTLICIGNDPAQAAEAYRVHAVDFLLEPMAYSHFMEAIYKARAVLAARQKTMPYIFVRESMKGILVSIDIAAIQYLECLGNYVKIFYEKDSYHLVHRSMRRLLQLLPACRFCRIEQSYAVHIDYIRDVDADVVTLKNGVMLKIGNNFRKAFLKRLVAVE
ncbi:LytR/AlgR family response regulator transcription factor [Sphingobacterium faecale]|uniref:LytTR family transcriptional regulator n=1 Tax=Sphingobacterium faecale TaxID=2803775 RepID=A0ABS1R7Y0_9SPHI|nr:LytTR family DNA-binding domain-containing protein [Sphingobacterium faecale]MBL1410824.1 LytTR family transcriptional regulator [Sphingobacterium faecale]